MKILGKMSIKQLLFDDLAEIVLPGDMLLDPQHSEVEVPMDPRFQMAKRMDIFVARAGQVTYAHINRSDRRTCMADLSNSPILSSCGLLT